MPFSQRTLAMPTSTPPARRLPQFAPVAKSSVVETLTRRIREMILAGAYRAGEALRQEALAEGFQVSRMPIREALRQLEAEGLVYFHTHRGAVVAELSSEDIEEIFALRALIEADLIRQSVPRATEADHSRARLSLIAMERACHEGDTAAWGETNWAFHAALYTPAQRPITLQMAEKLHTNVDRYVRLQMSLTPEALTKATEEHRTLHTLFIGGQADEAALAVSEHILSARDALLLALKENISAYKNV